MRRFVWCAEARDWVAPHAKVRPPVARSHLPTPYIISDHLPDIVNHADGKVYDSRSSYLRAVKAAGCEVVGDARARDAEPSEFVSPGNVERDVADTIDKLSAA